MYWKRLLVTTSFVINRFINYERLKIIMSYKKTMI